MKRTAAPSRPLWGRAGEGGQRWAWSSTVDGWRGGWRGPPPGLPHKGEEKKECRDLTR